MKEVGQIKMSVGVNQLMLVCQVNFSFFLGCHERGFGIWTLDGFLYLSSDVDGKILKFVQLAHDIRILWKKACISVFSF